MSEGIKVQGVAESGYETVSESLVGLSPSWRNHSVIQQRQKSFCPNKDILQVVSLKRP